MTWDNVFMGTGFTFLLGACLCLIIYLHNMMFPYKYNKPINWNSEFRLVFIITALAAVNLILIHFGIVSKGGSSWGNIE